MSKRLFAKYKSGEDFVRAARRSDNVVSIRQGKGDHVVIKTKSGQSIPVPMHDEISTGLRYKIIKLFLAAGIGLLLAIYVLSMI